MKKLICLICAVLLVAGNAIVTLADDTTPSYQSNKYEEATKLLNALLDGEALFSEETEDVTRGEFLHALLTVLNTDIKIEVNQIFSDVPAEHTYASDVYMATELGLIYAGDSFRPDDIITAAEAAKIAVNAVGYAPVADEAGGYPVGYMQVAKRLSLFDGVTLSADENISLSAAQILLFNLLSSDIKPINNGRDGIKILQSQEKRSFLEGLYDVYGIKGIVTAVDNHTLITNAELPARSGYVEIDGVEMYCDNVSADMLGKSVIAYVRDTDGDERLLCVVGTGNQEVSIAAEQYISLDGNRLQYYKDVRTTNLNLDEAYKVIYNGRRAELWDESMAEEKHGTIRLLDNNKDGRYDIVFVDVYAYGFVSGVDYIDKSIGVQYWDRYLELDTESCAYEVYDAGGTPIELFRLQNGMVVGVKESMDRKFYEIRVCDTEVSGTITKIPNNKDSLILGETAYETSVYFKNKYLSKNVLEPGQNITAVLGLHGEIVELRDKSALLSYGFVYRMATESNGFEDLLKVQMFNTGGELKVYGFAKKVIVDGGNSYDNKTIRTMITEQALPGVIRYGLNQSGEINQIDFAASADNVPFSNKSSLDRLTLCYQRQSLLYRPSCKGFNSYAMLNNAVVMVVPENEEERNREEYYAVGNHTLLSNNLKYTCDIYDIDENGEAGLVVVYEDSSNDIIKFLRNSYMIEEISVCVKDDVEMYELSCWGNGSYDTLYLPYDVEVPKTSGAPLVPGDLIRCKFYGDLIQRIYVDFDFSSGEMVFDPLGGGTYNSRICNGNMDYMYGQVYNATKNTLLISNTKNLNGEIDFSAVNLMPYAMGKNIVCFDTVTKQIRPIDADNIHTYLGYGEQADCVIIRQQGAVMQNMFVIR